MNTPDAGAGRTPALFLLLCLIGFCNLFAGYLRLPVLPLLATSLGAGPAQVGAINGAFMLSAGLLSIPAGLIADRVGRKGPIVVGILVAALSSLLITQCQQPWQMAAAYVLFGAGLAAFGPAMLSLVAETMPPARLGQAYGWYTTAIYIAMAVGPAAGGFLANHLGLRPVFFVSAGLLVAVALLALAALPQSAPRHQSDLRSVLAASVGLLRNRRLLACLLATIGSCIGFGVFLTFLPLHATACGLDPAEVGVVFTSQALVNVIGRIPIGRLADRTDRRQLVVAGLTCLALALPALGLATQLVPLIGGSLLLGVGMALTYTVISVLIVEQVPAAQRGLAMGMYNSCIFLGMMAGATLLGLVLKSIGYPLGFGVAGGVALLTLAGFGWLLRGARS